MKKYTIYIIAALVSLSLSSCEKFLDQELHQAIDSEDVIQNLDDAQVALTGCYSGLQNVELYARDLFVISDLAADNSKMNTSNAGRFLNIYQWSVHESNKYLTGIWDYSYMTIYLINKLLVDLEAIQEGDKNEKNRIMGEAKVLRSLIYFQLVNVFAQDYNYPVSGSFTHYGVPYVTEPIDVSDDPGRDLVSKVYSGIIDDLEGTATSPGVIQLLSEGTSPFYIDVSAAKALLSRVYLYKAPPAIDQTGTESSLIKARDYALAVINSGQHALVPNNRYIDSWSLASEETNEELIFTLNFSSIDNRGVEMLGAMYMEAVYGDILATSDLISLYEETDVRTQWFREADGITFIEKFPGRRTGEESADAVDVNINNHPLFRLAEIYLNAAEAEVLLGNDATAQSYVNAIIQRAGATPTDKTGSELLDVIKQERRKELCFEGHRLWDIKRWHDDLVRIDLTSPNVRSSIVYPNYLFAYPIPEAELEANSTIRNQQNPGY